MVHWQQEIVEPQLVTEVAADGSYVKVNKTFTIAAAGAGTAGTIDVNVLNNFVDEIAPS